MYTEYDTDLEAENRLRNLMWTVSGDYKLNTKLDAASWEKSKDISLYDAVKQGAFARYFDQNQFAMYLIKKIYYGAEERPLTDLAQMCVDLASWKKVAAERPGVPELRSRAFEALLDHSFHQMCGTLTGQIKLQLLRGSLSGDWAGEQKLSEAVEEMRHLEEASDTMEIIRTVDHLYNQWIDRSFEKKHGDLEHVMAATFEDLKEFDWKDLLDEDAYEDVLEQYLNELSSRMTSIAEEEDEQPEERKNSSGKKVILLDEAAVAKMYSYMELNYGRSYLNEREQKRLNHRLCRGAHADCSLYFTDGILQNPVLSNAQYVNARKHAENNRRLYRNSLNFIKRSVEILTDELRRSLYRRNEVEYMRAEYGTIVPNLLWRVGRTEEPGKLFIRTSRQNNTEFVVDILMDASGSQRDRQGQVALQALILSEALSNHRIPHRIMSFCTFWDYTVMQRFREYDAPRSENQRILDYTTSANNRDGLAIRAAGDSLLQRPEENKILIVLSDGRPNDIIVNRPGSRNPHTYCGEYAIRDTAWEVRKLRSSGVHVLGVFAGKEKDLQAEKKIFGRDFAYIRDIRNFSRIAGQYLRRLLEWDAEDF